MNSYSLQPLRDVSAEQTPDLEYHSSRQLSEHSILNTVSHYTTTALSQQRERMTATDNGTTDATQSNGDAVHVSTNVQFLKGLCEYCSLTAIPF